ncbi:MAG: fibronectin type III domain-containing protein, partial [Chloroflexota bacterium]
MFRIDGNQLTGNIPLWLFNNPNLVTLNLNKNLLTGQIPAGLSNLTQLQYFEVAYNQLSGDIPVAITTLTHIIVVNTGYNMLTASNATVKTFLDTKNPGWDQSQTITPANVQIGKVTSNSVEISWNPIPYTGDGGYYEVGYASTSGGPYTSGCTTANKILATCIVSGLTPNTPYYFAVHTSTPAHDVQKNALSSSYSQEVSSTTFPTTICDAAADYSECQALWLLYNGTNGANWTNKANWVANATPCTWYGVTCNVGGSVTQLSLGTNNLVGSIPTQLSYLTNLQQLSLNGNTLTGNIPAQMGSLVSLQNLNLSSNQLSGSIPTQLGSLSNLVDLSLGGNQLSGSIPTQLGSLTSLQTLSLGENQLSGSIPTQLGNLVNLVTLNLANNALSGSIPIELSNITNPLTLDISFNLLTAVDANLIIWLNTKQPTWASTQTVAPTVILPTVVVSTNTIRVSWNPITYTADGGYYEVGYSSNINGPFNQSGCTTADKTVTTCDVHNLGYNTSYYFAVRTFTPTHGLQQNALLSGFSTTSQGTTPTNDNFANSIIIPKPPYTDTLSNAVATLENLEQKGACEGTTNI